MAFIPDEAIYSGGEITQSAFRVYACYCAHRNHTSQTSTPGRALISQETGVNPSYVSTCRTELVNAGWIEIVNGDEVRLLKGDFSPVNRSNSTDKPVGKSKSFTREAVGNSESYMDERLEIPNDDLENPNGPFGNSKRPYIEPEQLTRTENQEAAARTPIAFVPDPDNPLAHPAVVEYNRVMKPDPGLSIRQCEVVAANVKDMAIWDQVLTIFAGNEHRGRDGTARAVGNAIDRYRKEVARAAREGPPGKPIVNSGETYEQRQTRLQQQQQQRLQAQRRPA